MRDNSSSRYGNTRPVIRPTSSNSTPNSAPARFTIRADVRRTLRGDPLALPPQSHRPSQTRFTNHSEEAFTHLRTSDPVLFVQRLIPNTFTSPNEKQYSLFWGKHSVDQIACDPRFLEIDPDPPWTTRKPNSTEVLLPSTRVTKP
ncbi:hypothetical protein PISMIDRAFT_9578 [Pisolithus microcarpus 441]|uniref:Uncharacterized protein n=1 Tax=Pisolithus microcarpus 441 TaxID=765257 RepID=A0A0C9ZHX3_9AGAM|nr:hypothetical protein PISMIDRAFT_9578 [Pisolithus microcarpus 441]